MADATVVIDPNPHSASFLSEAAGRPPSLDMMLHNIRSDLEVEAITAAILITAAQTIAPNGTDFAHRSASLCKCPNPKD
jgi:hypothetical protein